MRLALVIAPVVGAPMPLAQARHERLEQDRGARGVRLRPAVLGGVRDGRNPAGAHARGQPPRSATRCPSRSESRALLRRRGDLVSPDRRRPIRREAAPTSSPRTTSAVYPALIAAAALLVDYVLTVSVSVVAGIAALTSAVPALHPYRIVLSVLAWPVIALGQPARRPGIWPALRGADLLLRDQHPGHGRRTGLVGAIFDWLPEAPYETPSAGPRGHRRCSSLLRAYAAGCTALTGRRRPSQRQSRRSSRPRDVTPRQS